MRLLADEDVHGQIVSWLRMNGHDVVWLAETDTPITDHALLDLAERENRVVLTCDVDLAELTFHQYRRKYGLILLKLENPTLTDRLKLLQAQRAFLERHARGVALTLDKGILGFAG